MKTFKVKSGDVWQTVIALEAGVGDDRILTFYGLNMVILARFNHWEFYYVS